MVGVANLFAIEAMVLLVGLHVTYPCVWNRDGRFSIAMAAGAMQTIEEGAL